MSELLEAGSMRMRVAPGLITGALPYGMIGGEAPRLARLPLGRRTGHEAIAAARTGGLIDGEAGRGGRSLLASGRPVTG
jgi:hypothetical protein